jgi:hypothetical protein
MKDLKFRHSNGDCRRSLTPQDSMFSRNRGGFGFCGSNDKIIADSEQQIVDSSILHNLNAINLFSGQGFFQNG